MHPRLYKRRYKKFINYLIIIAISNILDGMLTIWHIEQNNATELNPIMNKLYMVSPILFMLYKLLVVNLSVFMLGKNLHTKVARLGTCIIMYVYLLTLIYHIYGLFIH